MSREPCDIRVRGNLRATPRPRGERLLEIRPRGVGEHGVVAGEDARTLAQQGGFGGAQGHIVETRRRGLACDQSTDQRRLTFGEGPDVFGRNTVAYRIGTFARRATAAPPGNHGCHTRPRTDRAARARAVIGARAAALAMASSSSKSSSAGG